MSAQRDGGSAFPLLPPLGPDGTSAVGYPYVSAGITLRDYFAAKALAGMLAHSQSDYSPLDRSSARRYAADAYACADAMLNAREADE